MIGKRAIAAIAGSVLMLAAISGLALAHGFGGRGGGSHEMFLLAHAAGLNHDQVRSAFENDASLKTDRTNLKNAHEAMMSCLVTPGKDCSSEVTSFSNAVQAMTQERMTVWAKLFSGAPNLSRAANLRSQLQQLHAQKMQLMQNVFSSQGGEGSSASE